MPEINWLDVVGWFLLQIVIFIQSLIYAGVGIVLLFLAYKVFDWLTPMDMDKEIFEENKTAVAIAVGAFVLGIALVIGAAIAG
jgi:uncharacterized membrane protein YjfL (UPF0719 family)